MTQIHILFWRSREGLQGDSNWRFCWHRRWFQVFLVLVTYRDPADEVVATCTPGWSRDRVFCCCEDAEEGRMEEKEQVVLNVGKIMKYPTKAELILTKVTRGWKLAALRWVPTPGLGSRCFFFSPRRSDPFLHE